MLCMGRHYRDIRNRISPEFYLAKYIQVEHVLDQLPNVKRLGDLASIIKDGPGGWNISTRDYCDDGVPFLGVSDIHNGIDFEQRSPTRITWEKHRELKKSQLKPHDVLLSVRGTVGISTVVPDDIGECHISASLVRIELREGIDPEYVSLFLHTDLGRLQVQRYGYKAAQPDVNLTEVRSLRVPVPPLERQQEIVAVMQAAYAERDAKLQEAEKLVGEIDSFVMQSLGIRFEEPPPKRAFRSGYRIFSDRMDVEYYRLQFSVLEQALEESGYPLVPLGRVVHSIRNGIDFRDYVEVGTPYIRVADVSENGRINVRGARQIAMSLDELDKTLQLKEGDVLFTRKGTPGNVAVVRGEVRDTIISSEIILLRLRSIIDPEYFEVFMNSLPGRRQVLRNTRGALNVGINHPTLLRLRIPLPDDKRVQRTIAEGVYDRRRRSRELNIQAQRLIEKAKARVEAMILGRE